MTHESHEPVHTHGLADDCPGCEEIARNPIATADDLVLTDLIRLAIDPERMVKGRSENELVASAKILTTLERAGKLAETAPDLVARYLADQWHVELPTASIV